MAEQTGRKWPGTPRTPKLQTPYGDGTPTTRPSDEQEQIRAVEEENGAITQERPNVAAGETREKVFPGEIRDRIYLSPKALARMGMEGAIPTSLADTAKEGDKVYITVRAPAHYGKVDPGHLRELELKYDSILVPTDEQGQPHYATADLIYATVSRKEYIQKRIKRHTDETTAFTRSVIEGLVETADQSMEAFSNDPAALARKKAEAHAAFASKKQKWPRGMTLQQIEQHVGVEETLRIEREAARGGRSERPNEYVEWTKKMAEAKKKGGTRYSFPGQPVT